MACFTEVRFVNNPSLVASLVVLRIQELLKVGVRKLAGLVFEAGKVEEQVELQGRKAAESGHASGRGHKLLPCKSGGVIDLSLLHHGIHKIQLVQNVVKGHHRRVSATKTYQSPFPKGRKENAEEKRRKEKKKAVRHRTTLEQVLNGRKIAADVVCELVLLDRPEELRKTARKKKKKRKRKKKLSQNTGISKGGKEVSANLSVVMAPSESESRSLKLCLIFSC